MLNKIYAFQTFGTYRCSYLYQKQKNSVKHRKTSTAATQLVLTNCSPFPPITPQYPVRNFHWGLQKNHTGHIAQSKHQNREGKISRVVMPQGPRG